MRERERKKDSMRGAPQTDRDGQGRTGAPQTDRGTADDRGTIGRGRER